MINLYGRPEHAARITEMKTQLKETRIKLNETDARFPQIQAVIQNHWDR
jgi:uncharacterized sulfatase